MKDHTCKRAHTCSCDIQGLEPDESCPVHGGGEWPPRCEICGRLMKWPKFPDTTMELLITMRRLANNYAPPEILKEIDEHINENYDTGCTAWIAAPPARETIRLNSRGVSHAEGQDGTAVSKQEASE